MKSKMQLAAALLTLSSIASTGFSAEPSNAAAVAPAPARALKVGDAAPEFKVTQWFKGDAVTLNDKGTYIVECWATWCGPCIAVFPHLSELAKANEGKITVIGVNVWERKKPDEVKAFVDGQADKMSYRVAADGEGAIANNWLKAAGQNGIPCAFVVSKSKVMWIGHPARLDQKLLNSITDGSFDAAAFAKAKEREEAPANYFKQNVSPLLRNKDTAGAIAALEKMKAEFPDQEATINGHIERLKKQETK